MRKRFKFRVGLALGGGAARGLAHIGVLRALQREKIQIDLICGTSMGAIIGGAFAAGKEIESLEAEVRDVLSSEEFKRNRLSFLRETKKQRGGLFFSVANLVRRGIFFGLSNLRPSFLSAEEFASSIGQVLPDVRIEKMPLPFGAVALDLDAGREVLICKGGLRRAAAASSAIPGILPPVLRNGRRLIDGGWVDKIPVLPAFQMGADVVIAVDITAELDDDTDYQRGVDIMVRADSLKDAALVGHARRMADLVLRPAVRDVHWADFGAYDRCIRAGDEETTRLLPRIRDLLRRARLFSFVRPGPGRRLADLYMQSGEPGLVVD